MNTQFTTYKCKVSNSNFHSNVYCLGIVLSCLELNTKYVYK